MFIDLQRESEANNKETTFRSLNSLPSWGNSCARSTFLAAEPPPEARGEDARENQIDLCPHFSRLRRQNSTPTLIPPATRAILLTVKILTKEVFCFMWNFIQVNQRLFKCIPLVGCTAGSIFIFKMVASMLDLF